MPKLTDEQLDLIRTVMDSQDKDLDVSLTVMEERGMLDTIDDLKAQLATKNVEITELIVKVHGAKLADLDFRQQARELAEKWKGNREMEWVEKVHAEHETVRCIEDVCADELLALPGMKYSQEDV